MSKMRCPSCGRKVDNSDNFCRNCGTPLHQRGIPTIGDNGYYDDEPEEPRRNYGPRIAAIVIVLLAIIGGSAWWWIDSTNREQAAEELRRQQALDSIEAAEAAQAARDAARDDSLRRDSLARTALTPDLLFSNFAELWSRSSAASRPTTAVCPICAGFSTDAQSYSTTAGDG